MLGPVIVKIIENNRPMWRSLMRGSDVHMLHAYTRRREAWICTTEAWHSPDKKRARRGKKAFDRVTRIYRIDRNEYLRVLKIR